MKIKLLTLCSVSTIFLVGLVYASNPWLGKTLSPKEVKSRWGQDPFNEEKFRVANTNERAKMAYSLITSKKLLGLTANQVREKLGKFDGHYFSEAYPTFLIQIGQKEGDESWQIVFLIDRDRKTKEVIVHKNCCD